MRDDHGRFLRKAEQQLSFLKAYDYANFTDVQGLQLASDLREDKRWPLAEDADWQPVALGAKWAGRDKYFWLQFTLSVPQLTTDAHYVLHLDLGRTGEGNNSGFEGLVFVGGYPRQAVDSNHEDVYFDQQFSNRKLLIQIKMWTGLEGGGVPHSQHYVLKALCAGVIAQPVIDSYDYLRNIVDTVAEFSLDEPLRYRYQTLITQSFAKFDWATLTPATIVPVCEAVLGDIHAFIAANAGEKKAYTITAVGHAHIDVAWLWRLRHTREKVARSFSTVLALMDEYPDYVFIQSTAQDYAFLQEDYPELYQRIEARIKEGRWEANGATWLEPDTNIPSGEALTRQFLYGIGYFQQHFQAKQSVLWLPDVFGYSAAMPQIMKGFGVDNFMTTKISWNDTNRMPHDTFYWQGIDGSKVLTHFMTTVETGPDWGENTHWRYMYNGEVNPKTVVESYHEYADKPVNDDLLLSYGFGDGGGGPSRESIKNVKILNELPGLPTVRQGRVDDYFARLAQTLADSPEPVATWRGELYLEYHRGTYTSQAAIKNWDRRAEFALRNLELNYATAHVQHGIAYPTEIIADLWRVLLRNQFHDILPGSSIHEVYEDAAKEFAGLFAKVAQLQKRLDAELLQPATGKTLVYNPLAWAREEVIETNNGPHLVSVPALGYASVPATAPIETATSQVETGQLTTPYYVITYATDGTLKQIQDVHSGQTYLDEVQGSNLFTLYEDRPLDFDNWNIDADYSQKATPVHATALSVKVNNAYFTDVETTYHFGESTLTQTMRLYCRSPRIDFKTHVEWHQHQELLRVAFNTTIQSEQARFDIQYGNVLRSTTDNTSWDEAKFETVGHKWADLSQTDHGLALLNDCKYGYRVKDKQLSLTLLKAGNYPDPDADQGAHTFTYALLPHTGDFLAGDVEAQAMALNQPFVLTSDVASDAQPLFTFDADHPVALDAVKMSEDGQYLIVRVHDYSGSDNQVILHPTFTAKKAQLGNLNESIKAPQNLLVDGMVTLALMPYAIQTICFTI